MSVRTFLLPDLGEGLTEAELVTWLVAVGDEIRVDQPVAELETAKSLVEVPSPFAGTVAQLHGEAGQMLDVGRPLISVTPSAAAVGAFMAAGGSAAAGPAPGHSDPDGEAYRQEERAGSGNVLIGYGTPGGTGAARRTRRPRTAVRTTAGTTAETTAEAAAGRRMPAPLQAPQPAPLPSAQPLSTAEAPRCISPLVRKLARNGGLLLADISGTGPEHLLLRSDVETALAAAATAAESRSAAVEPGAAAIEPVVVHPANPAVAHPAVDSRTGLAVAAQAPVTGLRKAAAANLTASRRNIPEATVWVDVDATALVELRADLKRRQPESTPGLLAFLARFVLAGLAKFPELNTRFEPGAGSPAGAAQLTAYDGVNLGFAVQSGRGLVVPSIRRADTLNARQLDTEIRRLTASAREGKASPAELTSGTFTLNNYGVFGVDGSAAIINYPESAMLGIGRIIDKPWVVDGALAVRKLTELTLVFDHRICDGATAGGFLRYVADAVENPGSVLADL